MKITPVFNNQNRTLNKKTNNATTANSSNISKPNLNYCKEYYLQFCGVKPIRFEKAQTIGEAKDFGRRILGIAQYTDFYDEFNDLNVINYINEGLVELRNTSRTKPRLPRYIYLEDFGKVQMSTRFFGGGELTINRKIYDTQEINVEIKRIFDELKKDGLITDTELSLDIKTEELDELFKKLSKDYKNLEQLTYDEKIELYNGIRVIAERTTQLNRFPKDLIIKMFEAGCWGEFDKEIIALFSQELKSCPDEENFKTLYSFLKEFDKVDFKIKNDSFKHRTLFHEVGHLQDIDIFFQPSAGEFSGYENYSKEMKEWVNDKKAILAAFEVSPYACYGAPEFVAETYAMLLAEKELSENVINLYEKLGGPKVVLRHN